MRLPIRAIALDKDGTFVDFDATWGGALVRTLDDLTPDQELAKAISEMLGFDYVNRCFFGHSVFIGGSNAEYGVDVARMLGVPFDEAFDKHLMHLFHRHVSAHVAMVPGSKAAIAALAGLDLPLAVITNDGITATQEQIKRLEIAHHFAFVVGSDCGHGAKPGGGMIRAFADHLGIAPSEILMVGDTVNDARAAKDAGAHMAGVLSGPERHPDFDDLCDVVLPSLGDLQPWLKGLA
jgi:phosphoglycolate phosphatase